MLLTDLADAARTSGLPIIEVDGWRTRGHGHMYAVQTIVCHHTATPATAPGDYPSLGIVRDGRPDLSGPLAQLGLGRDGTVYVIAAGVAYHAGEVWNTSQDNWHAIGIEAEHDGIHPWPPAQVAAYARLVAALIDHYDLDVTRVLGHKEVCKPAGRKTDPNFDMDAFRAQVTATSQEDDMATYADQLDTIDGKLDQLLKGQDAAKRRDQRAAEKLKKLITKGSATKAELEDLQAALTDGADQ